MKIENLKLFEKIKDKYKIKEIKNKILFKDYNEKENELPLHYYGASSRYTAKWKCHKCGFEEKKSIKLKNKHPNCKNCKKLYN